jgi:hypothetical protein
MSSALAQRHHGRSPCRTTVELVIALDSDCMACDECGPENAFSFHGVNAYFASLFVFIATAMSRPAKTSGGRTKTPSGLLLRNRHRESLSLEDILSQGGSLYTTPT